MIGVVRGYRVYYRELDNFFPPVQKSATIYGPESNSTILANLYKAMRYSIFVVVITTQEGPPSNLVEAKTLEGGEQ